MIRRAWRSFTDSGLVVEKDAGKVAELEKQVLALHLTGTSGIGHTRWATHGAPNRVNAHPHTDDTGGIALVHNGIIENYAALRKELSKNGSVFTTDTDTEVLAHLIRQFYDGDLTKAVRRALLLVQGTYGLAIVSPNEPGRIVVARMGSPMIIGHGEGENFVASDAAAFLHFTRDVTYMEDGEIATLTAGGRGTPHAGRHARRPRPRADHLRHQGHREGRLPALHAEGDFRAGFHRRRFDARPHSAGRGQHQVRRPPRLHGRAARSEAHHPHRLRHELARGAGGRIHDRGAGRRALRSRIRLGIPLPLADHRAGHGGARDLAVGRNAGHAGRDPRSQAPRRARHRHLQRRRLQHRARNRRRRLPARGSGNRRRLHQGVHRPDHRAVHAGAVPRAHAAHRRRRGPRTGAGAAPDPAEDQPHSRRTARPSRPSPPSSRTTATSFTSDAARISRWPSKAR